MFEKLLSALPFNPGTVQQLSFYAKRVRQEQAVRRIGLVFIVLAFLVQFFAFVSPPTPTLADSPNDLINGGFTSNQNAAMYCNNNTNGYQTILSYYGISCATVASAPTLTINSRELFGGQPLWSMGCLQSGNLAGNQPVTIGGGACSSSNSNGVVWERYLSAWDSPGTSSNYQVLNVTTTGGQTFFLMYACGNLVSVGPPQAVQKPPVLSISKTTIAGYPAANTPVKPGDVLGYRIYFNNTGGPATNVAVADAQPANTTFYNFSASTANIAGFSGGETKWGWYSMPGESSNWYVDTYYKVNANVGNGTNICNTATIYASGTPTYTSNQICMPVQVNSTPTPTPPPPKPSQPSCEQQVSSENTSACLSFQKSARNVTENIPNANGTTAQAGDTIQYTLSTTNNGSDSVSYPFSDNLSYVLDYSSLVDAGGGSLNTTTNYISWPAENIGAGQTVTKQFEVKIDNPIPSTPASTSDPQYYNMTMTNSFGNTIVIKLPPTPVQAVQTASASLPNTGPGNSIIIGAIVLAVAGFFFYRSRLVAREAKIAIAGQAGEV